MKPLICLMAWITGVLAFSAESAEPGTSKFSFGNAEPPAGYRRVTADNTYSDATGFGFEPGSVLQAKDHFVTCEKPFLFSVKLAEGNYRVLIAFGDEDGASSTTVKAEARRLMLENLRTAKVQTATNEITVNVRTARISESSAVKLKQRERETEMVTWDERLTMEFNGTRTCLRSIRIEPVSVPTVFLSGDSTVCDQPVEPWNSWGQMLPRFFKPGIAVANYAQSGESIKSSLGARRFEKIFSVMKPGDWLFIQFGHNDMKDKAADALATYRDNLKRLVAQTREKGGISVLITSMERKAGVARPTLGEYPATVRAVARETGAALIDLHASSIVLYGALGAKLDQAFQDGTHHNNYGSYELAKCVATGVRKSGLGLARFLVEDVKSFDPAHPDAVEAFAIPASPVRSNAKPDGN